MKSMGVPTPDQVYQDFEPSMEWVPEDDSDTLLVFLPGFSKEQLRVQLRARNLILSGERKLQQNTWSRFRVEFPVSANCDLNKISAKFEGNILFVRQPKLITLAPKPEEDKQSAVVEPVPKPQNPVADQKPADEYPTPRTQYVPEKGAEEKSKKHEDKDNESKIATQKKTSFLDKKNKKVVYEELDKKTKRALENYKRAVGVFAAKLKTSRNTVNTVVILLVGFVIGIYVSGSIKSWRTV